MNTSLFDVTPAPESDPYRTDAGKLRTSCMKATNWFSIEEGLKPLGASAYPNFFFKDRNGDEHSYSIAHIVERYENFKGQTHGRKVSS